MFPKIASVADKAVFIRSIVGGHGDHYSFQCLTGQHNRNMPPGGWPAMGSVLSKLYGPKDPALPAYVGLSPAHGAYALGRQWTARLSGSGPCSVYPHGEGRDDMVLQGITVDRLAERRGVLASFDRFRNEVDRSGMMEGVDSFTEAGRSPSDQQQAGRCARYREGAGGSARSLWPGREPEKMMAARGCSITS